MHHGCRHNAAWARRSLFQPLRRWYFTLSHFVGRCIAGFRATDDFIVALYHFTVPTLQTDFYGNWSWFGTYIYHALPCSKKNFKWLTCGLRNCSHIPITLKKQYSRPRYPQVLHPQIGICSSGTRGHRGLTVLSSCNLDDSLKIECSLYTAKVESKSNLRHSNPPIFHLKTNPKMTGILSGALWLSAALSEVLLTQLWVRRGRGRAWQIPCPHKAKHPQMTENKVPCDWFWSFPPPRRPSKESKGDCVHPEA